MGQCSETDKAILTCGSRQYLRIVIAFSMLFLLAASGRLFAQALPAYVLSGPVLPLLVQMPENSWLQVNANFFSDVWTPPDLEPLTGAGTVPPSKIILAWSGFAWDSNRGDLILYGGGHANYSGNDVYRWHSANLQWERASLPSEIRNDPVSGYQAIDGVDAAPSSAHTYKNNIFLPIVDRFLTWGGAAFTNGGAYLRVSESDPNMPRPTGPYLFDPNRADAGKVGGTTGSHVMRVAPHPEIVGGQMWQNRDIYLHLAGQAMPDDYVDGCASYAVEAGRDVVYVAGTTGGSTNLELYRYQLTDLANPLLDQIGKVGAFGVGTATQTTCGYDSSRNLFVRTGDNAHPFSFWDLTSGGPNNLDQNVQIDATIAGLQSWLTQQNLSITNCALEFDPGRRVFSLWCGAETVWELHPPVSGNGATGWTIVQMPAPQSSAPPGDTTGTGILGKWRYAPFFDAFVGLEDINDGNIWIYKPSGWVQPNPAGNALPRIVITSPANSANFAPGTPISIAANASDPDGTISRVEFYVNGSKIGQVNSPPYVAGMTPLLVGQYTIIAVAVDNVGGMTASAPISVNITAQITTAILQRGLNGFAGVTDTYLSAYWPATALGASDSLLLDPVDYVPLLRFAIFQSEGGPIPDGVVVQSATLELFKEFYDDTFQLNSLLKPWTEAEATWVGAQSGIPWAAAGASGAGTDYVLSPDALTAGDFNPGWVSFDVTSRIRQWSASTVTNYGWRMAQGSASTNFKEFLSSEYAADTTLRPKLTVVYAVGGVASAPTTTSVASSKNPSAVGTSVTFTATVAGSNPTGSVNFKDGANSISGCSAVALVGSGSSKTATCSTSALAAATHSITAAYAGDAGNAASTSAALSQVVNSAGPAPTTTVLASSLNPSTAGASVSFTTTVAGSNPTGSVNFKDGASSIGGCSAVALVGSGNSKTATCSTNVLSAATHSITAAYSGDAGNAASTSAALSQVVNATSSINVALATNGGIASASSTFIPGFPVSAIINNERTGANWGVSGGWNDNTADAYPDWVQINFNGSKTIDHVVVYTLQDNYATPVEPTDTMTFSLYGITAFTVQGWNGSSWVNLGTVSGNNLVKRTVNFSAFTTDRIRINVTAALNSYSRIIEVEAWGTAPLGPGPSTTTLASSLNPSTPGGSVTFTATVVASNPTGIVNFKDGASSISGCSAIALVGSGNSRTAACSTGGLTAATHSITAAYSGDADNAASTSPALLQVVNATSSINVALAANGGVASASSTYSAAFPTSAVIDNERAGMNWGNGGGWNDNTVNKYPDWVQINFNGSKTIDHAVIYTVQDNFANPVEPTDTMTFSLYGITAFTVQGWNGSSWVNLGSVSGNNLVKRTVNFPAYTTDRIRIKVTAALASFSRVTEIEAWGN